MSEPPLTAKQVAAVAAWWAEQERLQSLDAIRAIATEWRACGFTTVYSCVGWNELQRTMPQVAACIGRSVIRRHGLRP